MGSFCIIPHMLRIAIVSWSRGIVTWRHGCLVGVLSTRALDCGVEPHRIAIAATPGQATSIASLLQHQLLPVPEPSMATSTPSNAMFVLLPAAMTCPAVVFTFAEPSPRKRRAEPFLLRANVYLGSRDSPSVSHQHMPS
jgi:hypothetical protein